MPKPASAKLTKPFTTWVTEATAERVEAVAVRMGWTACQLIRQAVESHLPDVERAASVLESARRKP